MDNWQAWAAALFGFMLTLLGGDRALEKKRSIERTRDLYSKIGRLEEKNATLTERVIRVESEIMTEREVREILAEFMTPFLASLSEINTKSDNIKDQITEIRVALAKGKRDENSNI